VPIIFWDERLSTFSAQELLKHAPANTADDAAAAAVILQSYLDACKCDCMPDYGTIELAGRADG
jgi:RNase H-fold protein (predicted Holliday junction resolvase)